MPCTCFMPTASNSGFGCPFFQFFLPGRTTKDQNYSHYMQCHPCKFIEFVCVIEIKIWKGVLSVACWCIFVAILHLLTLCRPCVALSSPHLLFGNTLFCFPTKLREWKRWVRNCVELSPKRGDDSHVRCRHFRPYSQGAHERRISGLWSPLQSCARGRGLIHVISFPWEAWATWVRQQMTMFSYKEIWQCNAAIQQTLVRPPFSVKDQAQHVSRSLSELFKSPPGRAINRWREGAKL